MRSVLFVFILMLNCLACCRVVFVFLSNDTAAPESYTYLHTLSLHDSLPVSLAASRLLGAALQPTPRQTAGPFYPDRLPLDTDNDLVRVDGAQARRSEEHTSELKSLMRISYAVFCLKQKQKTKNNHIYSNHTKTTKVRQNTYHKPQNPT